MTTIADSSLLYAFYDGGDRFHDVAMGWMLTAGEDLVMTPLIVAEVDHLLGRVPSPVKRAFWDDLDRGVYTVRWWADGMRETLAVARRHPHAGLADASLVALAALLRTPRIATFDAHFTKMTTADGEALTIVPNQGPR